jgi:hypothetical protein
MCGVGIDGEGLELFPKRLGIRFRNSQERLQCRRFDNEPHACTIASGEQRVNLYNFIESTFARINTEEIWLRKYIVYYRVSTQRQGRWGLGLEAQQVAVQGFLAGRPDAQVLAEFTEAESGRKSDRKQLASAMLMARMTRGTLLIAKLDRLAGQSHMKNPVGGSPQRNPCYEQRNAPTRVLLRSGTLDPS